MALVGNFTGNNDLTTQQSGAYLHRTTSSSQPVTDGPVLGRPIIDRLPTIARRASRSSTDEKYSPHSPTHATSGLPPANEYEEFHSRPQPPQTMEETLESRTQHVNSLARHMSRMSTSTAVNPFEYDKDSEFDPFSGNFNARKWTKHMIGYSGSDGLGRQAGISFRNMGVHGYGSDADYQKNVANLPLSFISSARDLISNRKRRVQILNGIDGVLEAGEMLVVLGPPGSGCSTLLKTIAGEMNGIKLDEGSQLNYRGITPEQMNTQFRGEAVYTAEVDVHFPNLTVGDTLSFAAQARAPRHPPAGLSKKNFAERLRDVTMSIFGISHTINTIVGNDFVRGVSGGERKRVSIAEASLAGAPLQCWDNSTRGLDSANAIEFCKNLKMGAEFMQTTSVVAIYQAPQSAYDIFDKVSVLYEGEQIYFGKTTEAKKFFVDMGFHCPEQQTVPDFLTSLTSAAERTPREGFEGKVPTTPEEFAKAWRASPEYAQLQQDITDFEQRYPVKGEAYEKFLASRRAQQAKKTRAKSPYTLSFGQQVKLCLKRGFWRLRADPSLTFFQLFGNFAMALIIGSVFFNLPETTDSFRARGATLFFAVLLNAFGAALEILTLYAQRPIVEKHTQYAFYHASAEAIASMLTDLPYKILNAITFNLAIYFMTNLRRTPGAFFFFLLISFFSTLMMSGFFRSLAASSRTLVQALTPAAGVILGLVMYTGFAIPTTYMLGWSRWINYINPIAYSFEALMVNEFSGRQFACSQFVPSYPGVGLENQACSTVGAVAGQDFVDGDAYINQSYEYYASHKWRNFGILLAFMFAFFAYYLFASEVISAQKSKGEVLVYQKGHIPQELKNRKRAASDSESGKSANGTANSATSATEAKGVDRAKGIIQRQTAVFSWKDVVYDIKIKGETRRILDHVDGWVKPGTLTALMGVSGAGKTTLLDVLATRVTMGVVTGEMLVDGKQRDVSFQRKTGYVQQQDLHLATSTVREALRFSAVLRQPAKVPLQDKIEYVEEVLKLLEMDTYADAVVGVPGEGLNVEQRKRLTIGVELVAKPELLLFLDEPTSGLDSQTSWNILQLLRKLIDNGQAILCTIHQPSAILFEQFDRLLFLAKGGKTVYYGEVGKKSHILIDYFERNGAPKCPEGENPAEWMLSAIGAAPGSHTDVDWHQAWLNSPERVAVREELEHIKSERARIVGEKQEVKDKAAYAEFAAPFGAQFLVVFWRVTQQLWRTPSYIYSKMALAVICGLFIGFSFFQSGTSQQGLANQLFSVFLLFTMFGQLVQQIMPNFVTQRSLYEVRERPAKIYSWKVFILANILIELIWAIVTGAVLFFCWYYPIGYYRNAALTGAVTLRGAQMWLFVEAFMLFTSTFAIMVVAGMATAEEAGNIANLMFSLCLIFCGVLQPAEATPRFWIFMFRVSPFTYLVEGMLSTAVANAEVVCAPIEYLRFQAPSGQTCGQYMQPWISQAGGYLLDPASTGECSFCALQDTNVFLSSFGLSYSNVWRDFGLLWVYIIVNVFLAILFYWLARVPKKSGKEQPAEATESVSSEKQAATAAQRTDSE